MQSSLPRFDRALAAVKVRQLQKLWDTRDPNLIGDAYAENVSWRIDDTLVVGRSAVAARQSAGCVEDRDCTVQFRLWGLSGNRIAVRFLVFSRDQDDEYPRRGGIEIWEFDSAGLIRRRESSSKRIVRSELPATWSRHRSGCVAPHSTAR
jgi:nuclear transport factor 2 (NTF2) superfamily protein